MVNKLKVIMKMGEIKMKNNTKKQPKKAAVVNFRAVYGSLSLVFIFVKVLI